MKTQTIPTDALARLLLVATLVGLPCSSAFAEGLPKVRYFPSTQTFDSELPHDVPFEIVVYAKKDKIRGGLETVTGASLNELADADASCRESEMGARLPLLLEKEGSADVLRIPARDLKIDTQYCFFLLGTSRLTSEQQARFEKAIDEYLDRLVDPNDRLNTDPQIRAFLKEKLGDAFELVDARSGETLLDLLFAFATSDGVIDFGTSVSDFEKVAKGMPGLLTEATKVIGASRDAFSVAPVDTEKTELLSVLTAAFESYAASATPLSLTRNGAKLRITGLSEPLRALEEKLKQGESKLSSCSDPSCVNVRRALDDILVAIEQARAAVKTSEEKLKVVKSTRDSVRVHSRQAALALSKGTYADRATLYVAADVGYAMPIFGDDSVDLVPYVGVSFYLTAVDKDVSLEKDDGFLKRFSLIAGLTLDGLEDSEGELRGISGERSALVGAGLRLTDYIRFSSGMVVFRQPNRNPTLDRTQLRVTPYVALSVDSDVAGLITDAVKKATGK